MSLGVAQECRRFTYLVIVPEYLNIYTRPAVYEAEANLVA